MGKPIGGADAERALLDRLTQSVDRYATPLQRIQTAPYYSNEGALEVVLHYGPVIARAAEQYGVERETLQAVLFQELRFLNIFDEVDAFVLATYDYLQQTEDRLSLPRHLRSFSLPPVPPLVYRLDSSTGLGQIFAKTAIRALNWREGRPVYDESSWKDLRTVWVRLKTDDVYNIETAALVLSHKRSLLREAGNPDPSPADIMQAYNGTGELSVRYRNVALEYYLAFRAYNNAIEAGPRF